MASPTYTTTRNLKLRIDSTLTANAKSNLEKIDLLGSTFLVDSASTLRIRSMADISIEPESPDLGGSAVGGTLSIGNASQFLDTVQVNTSNLQVTSGLSTLDQSVAPTSAKYLQLQYLSSLLDTASDRVLYLDVVGGNRTLTLGGSVATTGGDLTITLGGSTSVVMPQVGTLATLAGPETLTHKTIDATQNTLQNISNASIASSAGITYSKLSLTGSIIDADISPSAAIAYSKLHLAQSIHTSDLVTNLALPYSYLNLYHSIVLNDLAPGIEIPGSAIVPLFLSDVTVYGSYILHGATYKTTLSLPTGPLTQTQDLQFFLPNSYGTSGQILATDGTGSLSWVDKSTGGAVSQVSVSWVHSDGLSKTIVHNIGTTDVDVSVQDMDLSEKILIDSIVVVDLNTITVTASEAPAGTWRVIIQGV